ncbi:MAG: molecular chaperone HtpG [Chloroflexi bacterium]|nr:molecular chaperone HtpG [Chloroflexota bacterium]
MTDSKPIAFKAEIKQLLDILIHSLYTDREIFLRELISNASDALTQMDFLMLTDRDVLDPDAALEIRLHVDEERKIITISDTGVGMARDELTTNLGTIAQSGARAFLDAAEEGVDQRRLADVIGQFGVGFYSVFMVAEWVRVTSRSFKPKAKAAAWYATGEDTFTVDVAEKENRGTIIEIKLKEDAEEFAHESRLRQIIKKHSDYVRFPIYVGDDKEQTNRQTAIWRQDPREVNEAEYNEFYKHLTLDFEDPLARVHFVADAPLRIFSLLYIPAKPERGIFSIRKEDGLKLYARKVLIQEYTTDLLPPCFRFVQGVVDSEDLPLNISRESIQTTALMARIKRILTGQINKQLRTLAEKEPDKYARFWSAFNPFIKEGIASQESDREELYPFVRFHTTVHPESWVSLQDYVERIKIGQDKIYYLLGDDERSVARSPHLDYFLKHGYEVITLTDPMDSFMLLGLREFGDYKLQNVAAPDLELPAAEVTSGEQPTPEALSPRELEKIIARFKWHLGERVTDVRTTDRLTDSVARLVDPEGTLGQEMQRVYRLVDREYEVPKKVLELNPRHPILTSLCALPPDDKLNIAIIEQIYESALLIEGLHPDPASMLPRIEALMEAALR